MNTSWELLRIWHVEVLSSVAAQTEAHTFTRTSYAVVPRSWRELPVAALQPRVETLLEASYRKRNHLTAQSGDTTEMWWIGYAFEWVDTGKMPALPADRRFDDVFVSSRTVHPQLIDQAAAELERQLREARPGVDSAPWEDGFSLFSVDAGGDAWKLERAGYPEAFAVFEQRLRTP